jgi:hypothetical protein
LFTASKRLGGIPILQGINSVSENSMPPGWIHSKHDAVHLNDIYTKYCGYKLEKFPLLPTWKMIYYKRVQGINWISAIEYFEYDKKDAEKYLIEKIDYIKPERKHEESLITKVYQRIILPIKFNADKRIGHLSSLINSRELSRSDAIELLKKPIYDNSHDLMRDIQDFCNYLNITHEYFFDYLRRSPVPHSHYKSDTRIFNLIFKLKNRIL